MLWTEKYKPSKISEIKTNNKEAISIKEFIKTYKRGSIIIYGPTGNGKTSSIYTIANELNYEVIEVNASDFRNKEKIQSIVGNSSKQKSLFNKGKIILIDEIEGLSGTRDRGAIPTLSKIIDESNHTIILTTIDPYSSKFQPLRKKSKLIVFKPVIYEDILLHLKEICKKENLIFNEKTLKSIALKSAGDLRAAINDLQTLKKGNKITDISSENERDRKNNIEESLKLIFKSRTCLNVLDSLNKTDIKFDEAFLWIDENLPREYSYRDIKEAYNMVSRADVFKGRIIRQQYWRFLVYINALLTAGIACSKKQKYSHIIKYRQTTRIFKMWRAKNKNLRKKTIAEKISSLTHCSLKKTIKETMPYIKFIHKQNNKLLKEELNLDEDELKYLIKEA
jgi:replication factor C large subunit